MSTLPLASAHGGPVADALLELVSSGQLELPVQSAGVAISELASQSITVPATSVPGTKGSGGWTWYFFWTMSASG